jgi:flagellar hook-length control protein FliK
VGEARVQLDPHHLGAVSVALRVDNGVVSAVITAEQPAVRHWLETHESSLRGSLSEQGLQLDRLRVEPDGQQAGDRASTGQEPPPRRRMLRKETATFELVA